jgi:polysaccharide deacetylase 2 family uncharacterized protein YibQ
MGLHDDLNAPLGASASDRNPARGSRAGGGSGAPWALVGFAGVVLTGAALAAFAWMMDERLDRGLDRVADAAARIERWTPPAPQNPPAPATRAAQAQADEAPTGVIRMRRSAEAVEEASGVKVVRQGAGVPEALIISVPQAQVDVGLAPAPDRRLVDKGRHGPLPRIGLDGAKPLDVYARPMVTPAGLRPGAPKLAIVVGGMGLNPAATQEALGLLPRAVTLGFAPYGPDLPRQTAQARSLGHEILLQAPLEGFGGPGESPGPNLLRAGDPPAETLNRLHWHMSRFPGYVGIGGHLGAKFTADAASLSPVLIEIANRGLMYFDDGGSTRSLALSLGAETSTPILRADVVIDARPEAVDDALIRLERIARDKGAAAGSAAALPDVVEKIARFARALETRGVALAPASALAAIPRPASAQAPP